MATSTNSKVFVSPGVYTSEVDLSFVAQSVGVTTLGIVGETLKGPAFEPIFIRNFDEFSTYFGGTSPEKFIGTQIPKYEAAYIAKAYLQQSNQLFVTRVLGLSGYDAGPSWSIVTKANVDPTTITLCLSSVTDYAQFSSCTPVCVSVITEDIVIPFTACTDSLDSVVFDESLINDVIKAKIDLPQELFDGSITTLRTGMVNQIFNIITDDNTPYYVGESENVYYYGAISGDDYTSIVSMGYTAETNFFGVNNVDESLIDFAASQNDPWYYALFDNTGNAQYSGYSFFTIVNNLTPIIVTTTTGPEPTTTTTTTDPCNPIIPTTTTTTTAKPVVCYTGVITGKIYYYKGEAFKDYDDLVIATLRSRGVSQYSSTESGPIYEVSGATNVYGNFTGDDVQMVCTGQYSGVTKNPYSTFGLNVTTINGETLFFETSFSNGDVKYLSKVFGQSNFAKPRRTVPLFVEETFQTLLNYGWRKGFIRGLGCSLTALPNARQGADPTSIAFYLEKYQSAMSPWVVSELRGNKVYNLFRFMTISDGDAANIQVKISIINISFNNGTFDLLVRDFFDTDAAPVVLEKYTNCTMDPQDNNFIGKKIGTVDGLFQLNSKFIMVEINEDAPIEALPCGFLGYTFREYSGVKPPFPIYKTKYDFPGEVVYNPPFGASTGLDDVTRSAGDNVRRTYLGISDTIGVDIDFYQYKGKQLPLNICNDVTGDDWAYRTRGFHMDINAASITIPDVFVTSGTPEFYVGSAPFTSDPDNPENPYYRLFARKFSFLCYGGFDGWDIYREFRTNQDRFKLGRNGYLGGACPSIKYPTATGWGAFKQITVGDNTTDFANTDYYAYLLGQKTFENPEAVNINVFVTPGVDYVNNSDIVEAGIEMIENDRADSIYICTTPDYNMYVPSASDMLDFIYPQEAVDNLDETGIDSNYTATYYPWVLTRDSVNNTQIYLPPTAEVTKNLALTDNIAFPWFAAAGYTRGIVNAIKARKKLTQEDRDILYKGRINPIATFSDVGTVIWGNKTLQVRESALDRINVRRLLLQARKLISAVSVRLLFEQNDAKVRQDFLDAVNPILDAIRRDRGLYDFRVTVSSDTADLDRNQLTGKIYIKPTRSLEFIDITFYITPTGASFENI
jgi:hypothetical protein